MWQHWQQEFKKLNNKTPYNVIGFGLSGAVISWQLYFNEIDFKVFDTCENHSTRTAAGLVNPMVFKRLTKSWKADDFLPFASKFYKKIEEVLGQSLLSNRPILRIISTIEEENNWSSKCGDERFDTYINQIENIQIKGIDTPHGVGRVNTIGNLNTKQFLDLSKEFFKQQGVQFVDKAFDYYEVNDADVYVFCEGFEVRNNFFFNYLPMKPTQGETLTIKTSDLDFEEILNKNMFVLPLGDGLFKVGATYNWELTETDVLVGKQELVEKLAAFADFEYEIIDHESGIRPTVMDRRPLIGAHPENKNLFIFNGMGTKGVMIAPFYADQFIDYLGEKTELDSEVDIKRYQKYYNV